MLKLAYECGKKGGLYPCILNAANEVCVYSFLERKIRFTEIFDIVEKMVKINVSHIPLTVENIIKIDNETRKETLKLIETIKHM